MRIEPGGSTPARFAGVSTTPQTISPVYKPTAPTTPSLATQYQEAVAAAAATLAPPVRAGEARDEAMRKRTLAPPVRAGEPVTPVGFGVPGYPAPQATGTSFGRWWQGMTPFIAPGGMAAPVMTAGNGAGFSVPSNAGALGIPSVASGYDVTDPYAGVPFVPQGFATLKQLADPTVPSVDPTVPVDPTPTEAPPTETPPPTLVDGVSPTAQTDDVIRPPKPKNFSESPRSANYGDSLRSPAWAKKNAKDNQANVGGIGNSTQNPPQGFVSAGGQDGMPILVSPTPSNPNGGFASSNPPPDWMKYWVNRNNPLINYALYIKPFGSDETFYPVGEQTSGSSAYDAMDIKPFGSEETFYPVGEQSEGGSAYDAIDIIPFGEQNTYYPVLEPKRQLKDKKEKKPTTSNPNGSLTISNPPPDWMKYWVARNDMLPKVNDTSSENSGTGYGTGGYSYTYPRNGGGYGGGGGGSYLPWWKWNLMNWRID